MNHEKKLRAQVDIFQDLENEKMLLEEKAESLVSAGKQNKPGKMFSADLR